MLEIYTLKDLYLEEIIPKKDGLKIDVLQRDHTVISLSLSQVLSRSIGADLRVDLEMFERKRANLSNV